MAKMAALHGSIEATFDTDSDDEFDGFNTTDCLVAGKSALESDNEVDIFDFENMHTVSANDESCNYRKTLDVVHGFPRDAMD